jgi:endonuclease YncB( thermonuclease family)
MTPRRFPLARSSLVRSRLVPSLLACSNLACLLALWGAFGLQDLHAGEAPAACTATITRDVLVAGGAHGELHLASGRTISLTDVRVAAGPSIAARGADAHEGGVQEARVQEAGVQEAGVLRDFAQAYLASQIGEQVELRLSAGAPDRWGRMRAAVVLSPDTSRLDLAHALVARGMAIVDTGAERLCDDSLLLREEQARRSRRGVWSEAGAQPLEAGDAAGLLARVGHFAIVEGVVRNVGERGRRTYLDFGRSWDDAFTVIVPKPLWTRLQDAGTNAATLRGRRIRIRGIMQNWRGPAIELTTVEFIEKLESRP